MGNSGAGKCPWELRGSGAGFRRAGGKQPAAQVRKTAGGEKEERITENPAGKLDYEEAKGRKAWCGGGCGFPGGLSGNADPSSFYSLFLSRF